VRQLISVRGGERGGERRGARGPGALAGATRYLSAAVNQKRARSHQTTSRPRPLDDLSFPPTPLSEPPLTQGGGWGTAGGVEGWLDEETPPWSGGKALAKAHRVELHRHRHVGVRQGEGRGQPRGGGAAAGGAHTQTERGGGGGLSECCWL